MNQVAKLKLGMEKSEVKSLLGEPKPIPLSVEPRWSGKERYSAQEWNGKSIGIRILFDADGRLCDWTAFITGTRGPELPDRLLDWIGF
jgi:hypothetical protein